MVVPAAWSKLHAFEASTMSRRGAGLWLLWLLSYLFLDCHKDFFPFNIIPLLCSMATCFWKVFSGDIKIWFQALCWNRDCLSHHIEWPTRLPNYKRTNSAGHFSSCLVFFWIEFLIGRQYLNTVKCISLFQKWTGKRIASQPKALMLQVLLGFTLSPVIITFEWKPMFGSEK